MDTDLLDLLAGDDEPGILASGRAGQEAPASEEPVDPLFEDAYDDFKAASNAKDAAEALRLMIRLIK